MQLGEQAAEFRKRGYGVAGLTYDNAEILRHFGERYRLQYALLSDPKSEAIRAFGILNEEIPAGHDWYGVPHPGMYLIGADGVVKEKFFEESVVERYTAASVLHLIESEDGMISGWAETEHLKITILASDYDIRPGNRVTLKLNVALKPGIHVYAPEVGGTYKPVRWEMKRTPALTAHEAVFPESKTLELKAIQESLPVYEGEFLVTRDVTLGQLQELARVVIAGGVIEVTGTFHYQACDDKECFRPREAPLKWTFHAMMHDPERVPEELRQ